jgi:hypothetical protein
MEMKKLIFAAIAAATVVTTVSPAMAAEGCGRGWHRGPYGHCRPNVAPGYGPGAVVIGSYYPHRGWWDGHRYWHHRDRWHGGWRYR